jgi:hypothetical protein
LLATPTIQEAATVAKCGVASIHRWLKEPVFQAALDEAASALIDGTVAGQIADFEANQETMREIRDDENNAAGVRLRAATALDASLVRWRELRDVERRLTQLEGLIHERIN